MAEMTAYAAGTPCWADLATSDVAAARNFYHDLLGWDYEDTGPEMGNYVLVRLHGKIVAGMYPLTADMAGIPPNWMTYLATDSVDDTVKRATDAGGTVLQPPMDVAEQGRTAVLRDPSDAVVGLWQAGQHLGAQLANEPGAFTWNELLTRNLPAARTFYTAVFGYGTDEMDVGASMPYVVLKVGDRMVGGLMDMPAEVPAEVPPHWMTYWAVADTDAAAEQVRKAGGSVFNGPADSPYGRLATVADPQGAVFTVIHAPQS